MVKQTKCDYSKGIIYKLKCLDTNIKDIYVGSTTNFTSRKTQHKSICNNPNNPKYNLCVYQFIREHGNWDNWEMVPIKTYSCNSHMELRIEEQSVIEELEDYTTLNRHRAFTTEEQRKEDEKQNNKGYRDNNKETIKVYQKEYRDNNKEILSEYGKVYWKNNRETILKRNNLYYKNNRETITEQRKEKVICGCGIKVRRTDIARHRKSIKHQNWEQQPEPNINFVD